KRPFGREPLVNLRSCERSGSGECSPLPDPSFQVALAGGVGNVLGCGRGASVERGNGPGSHGPATAATLFGEAAPLAAWRSGEDALGGAQVLPRQQLSRGRRLRHRGPRTWRRCPAASTTGRCLA